MRISWTIVLIACVLALSGCSGVPVTSPSDTDSNSNPGPAITGIVHGGEQPIVGARVYLFAAGTSGPGGASQSLLINATGTTKDTNDNNYYVTTQSGGTFSISNDGIADYTCPSAYSQVYLYAVGGDPGLGDGANSAIGLMAALGTCNSLNSSVYAVINEVSTVATAYALAGYATDALHISSSGSALATDTDVPNAFASVTNLETLSTGVALATTPPPASNGVVPQAEIDTLADILAACVNSAGPGSTPCSSLFDLATNGSTDPAETATAAINIAHNPGLYVEQLYELLPTTLAFQPTMDSAPNDWTISITYSGNGLDGTGFAPEGIAVDAAGDIWVPNYNSSTLSEFNSNGVPISGSPYKTGLNAPTSVAIDTDGDAWVTNYLEDSSDVYTIAEFESNGTAASGPPGFEGGGLNGPYGIAFDKSGNAWVSNFLGSSMSEYNPAPQGVAISPSGGYGSAVVVGPAGIAGDAAGDVWTANYISSTYALVEGVPSSLPGVAPSFTVYTGITTNTPNGAGLNSPYGVAVDASGNVWATNRGGNGSISEISPTGDAISGAGGYTGGGIDTPYGISIDGAGNVWTANNGGNANSISEFNTKGAPISGPNGYISSGLFIPYGIAVDGSGNVWVACDNTNGPLTEFVGAATPVVTPLSAGTKYGELATMP